MDRRLLAAVERDLGQRGQGGFLTIDGQRLFVKVNPHAAPGMFEREIEGLAVLGAVDALRIVKTFGTGGGKPGVSPFLVLEAIEGSQRRADFFELLGSGLAELHRRGRGPAFGFAHDNYLGATPQPNRWTEDWIELWREQRLGHQLELARCHGLATGELSRLGDQLSARLEALLAVPNEPPTLLHGDLWGGNYLVDEHGQPVLIDPAAYYGRREADLAMTYLFGGFEPRFYSAYQATWPLEPGADERIEIYKLYHLLNHLNLFGGSYLESCLAILRRFA